MKQRRQRPLGPTDSRASGRSKHGMTRVEIHAREAEQGHACAVCGKVGPLVQDHSHVLARLHDHPDGRGCPRCNRALLCNGCNTALGYVRDDPETLRRLALYVEFWTRELGAA